MWWYLRVLVLVLCLCLDLSTTARNVVPFTAPLHAVVSGALAALGGRFSGLRAPAAGTWSSLSRRCLRSLEWGACGGAASTRQ